MGDSNKKLQLSGDVGAIYGAIHKYCKDWDSAHIPTIATKA
jgi:hypothetical protein